MPAIPASTSPAHSETHSRRPLGGRRYFFFQVPLKLLSFLIQLPGLVRQRDVSVRSEPPLLIAMYRFMLSFGIISLLDVFCGLWYTKND